MNQTITQEKLNKYFSITKEALDMVEGKLDSTRISEAEDFLDMATRYFKDAKYFSETKKDFVLAFAALN